MFCKVPNLVVLSRKIDAAFHVMWNRFSEKKSLLRNCSSRLTHLSKASLFETKLFLSYYCLDFVFQRMEKRLPQVIVRVKSYQSKDVKLLQTSKISTSYTMGCIIVRYIKAKLHPLLWINCSLLFKIEIFVASNNHNFYWYQAW